MYKKLAFISIIFILFSCKKESYIFKDNFKNNNQKWDTLSTALISNEISNNSMILINKLDNVSNFSLIEINISQKDFRLSTSIKLNNIYTNKGLGGIIAFADHQKHPKNYFFFGVNKNNEIVISYENGKTGMSRIYYKKLNKNFKKNQVNEFSILTYDDDLHFSLNKMPLIKVNKPFNNQNYFGYFVLGAQLTSTELSIKSGLN